MNTGIAKRSVIVNGHKTSISLEGPFWEGLKELAHNRSQTVAAMVSTIAHERQGGNLSSTLRLFVLDQTRRPPIALA